MLCVLFCVRLFEHTGLFFSSFLFLFQPLFEIAVRCRDSRWRNFITTFSTLKELAKQQQKSNTVIINFICVRTVFNLFYQYFEFY